MDLPQYLILEEPNGSALIIRKGTSTSVSGNKPVYHVYLGCRSAMDAEHVLEKLHAYDP